MSNTRPLAPMRNPPHPGALVREDLLKERGLTVTEAAAILGVSRPNLSLLINERIALSPEMALKLEAAFGVEADMATYGKLVGGGLPIGIVAGKAPFLDCIDGGAWAFGDESGPAARQAFFAGTFNKNALAMAAAHAVLTEIKRRGPSLQRGLNEATEALVRSIDAVFRRAIKLCESQ